jgi:hypothetical protein
VRLDWKKEEAGRILAWAGEGGHLVLYLTGDAARDPRFGGEGFGKFLKELGIRRVYDSSVRTFGGSGYPWFSGPLAFKPVKENPRRPAMTLRKDAQGIIRLIVVPVGKGSVTVCALPRFMHSGVLHSEENAVLSWQLTGERDPEKNGVLFIRGRGERDNLYANLAVRGRPVFPILSALIVVIAGFWMVIPIFGRRKADVSRPGRSIGERFLAEGLFLKRFRALETYLDAYIQEIRFKLRNQPPGFVTKVSGGRSAQGIERPFCVNDACKIAPQFFRSTFTANTGELERIARSPQSGDAPDSSGLLASHLASRCGLDEGEVENALAPGAHIRFREFLRYRKILETILEKL